MSLNFLQSLYRKSSKYNHSSDEFDDELPTDSYKYTKLGFIFLGIGFGGFDDIELAGLVAEEARNKYHGKFARHN